MELSKEQVKSIMQTAWETITEFADVPKEPELPSWKASSLLYAAENYLEEIEYTKDQKANLKALKKNMSYYNRIIEDHYKRESKMNLKVDGMNPEFNVLAIQMLAKKSDKLVVVDTGGVMPVERAQIFQDFVKHGGELTLFTTQNPETIPEQTHSDLHILSLRAANDLRNKNIVGLIVGNGNEGCYSWEKNKPSQGERLDRMKADWALLKEDISNLFRKNKITAAKEAYVKLSNTPVKDFHTEVSFFCPDKAKELYWMAGEVIRSHNPDTKMPYLNWGFKK